ncbi:MAG: hypothetical protein WCE62_09960 [Polyangiales bacterium]
MLVQPFIRMVALSCIALSVACDGSIPVADKFADPDNLEDTEVKLVISDPNSSPDELAFSIDFVSYRITCPASGGVPYDDSIDISGSFEIIEDSDPPVWALFTSLPPTRCTISMWVFYEDEIVCSGSQALPIAAKGSSSAPNEVTIVLECMLSVNPPSGDLDIIGAFDVVHGNFCPQLVWLGAIPTVFDPGDPGVARIETYSFDVDDTCGQNCDPKICDFSANPPTCTPGPDTGLVSTLTATAGHGAFGDVHGSDTTYTCDPLFPGPTEICVSASDGDLECDQTRCVTIVCPGP